MIVASWNVLADAYVRPAFYPLTPDACLDPAWRRPALVARAAALGADVLCLQEAEPALIAALGGGGHFAAKGGGKPDGCATFARLPVRGAARLEYGDGTGHVALVVVVEAEGALVAVAGTHLRWDAAGALGGRQIAELLGQRQALAPGVADWIVAGDFNAGPRSPACAALADAGFTDAYAAIGGMTCNSNRVPKRIDFIWVSEGLRAEPVPLPRLTADTPLPSADDPSDHRPIVARITRPR